MGKLLHTKRRATLTVSSNNAIYGTVSGGVLEDPDHILQQLQQHHEQVIILLVGMMGIHLQIGLLMLLIISII
jgi:hypothetical protein